MELVILLALIALNGVFALSELAIVSSRRNRLQMRVDKGDKGAKVALKLKEDPSAFLSTVQVGITLIGIIAGAYGATALAEDVAPVILQLFPALGTRADLVAFGVVIALTTYLSIVIGELVPKRIAITAPEAFASIIAPPMALLARIVFPVVFILRGSTNLILGLFGLSKVNTEQMTEEELESVIEEGAASGAIDADERNMIRSVLRLADRDVRSIMTSRKDVVWLDLDEPADVLLKQIAEAGHSRFPVARGDLEHVISVVQTKDLLALSEGKRLPDFETAGHAPLFVPDTMTVLNLLESIQSSAVQMALVSDELGHIEGIVTAADVLGAIAGDVAFSAEDGLDRPQRREDGSWLIDGRMAIEDAEIALGARVTLEEDPPYTTMAGLVINELQRIAQLGDTVTTNGWRLEVIDMDERRIDKLLVARLPAKEEDPTG